MTFYDQKMRTRGVVHTITNSLSVRIRSNRDPPKLAEEKGILLQGHRALMRILIHLAYWDRGPGLRESVRSAVVCLVPRNCL